MNDSPIEDIKIERPYTSYNRKKGKGIKILILLLFILVVALCCAYWYLMHHTETEKQAFFRNIANSQIEFFTDNEVYNQMINKYTTVNSETNSNIKFSTTMENEMLEGIDVSKFLLDLKTIQDINQKASYHELGISYSDNDLLQIKFMDNLNEMAITSDEIVNKYVGMHKENEQEVLSQLGLSTWSFDNASLVQNIITNQMIQSSEEEKTTKINEYVNMISEAIPEEDFTRQENIVIQKDNNNSIDVTAYTLTLSAQEFKQLYRNLLTTLRNDRTVLEKLVVDENSVESTINGNTINNTTTDTTNTNIAENVTNENNVEENRVENEGLNISSSSNLTPVYTTSTEEENNALEETSNITMKDIMIACILGRKLSGTVSELQNCIDQYLEVLDNQVNNGITITVYANENHVEKITVILPNHATVDLEFSSASQNENTIKITYLIEESAYQYDEQGEATYSAEDNTLAEGAPNVTTLEKNGFSLEVYKLKNDASTTMKITYNFIENEKINRKVSFNITTEGSASSRKFNNDAIITYSSNEGEVKATIENQVTFDENIQVEELTEENCLYLDTLSDEELQSTIQAIEEKINSVYEEKRANLNFIDNNMPTPDVQLNSTTREKARDVIVNAVSNKMGEALANGEEYTIQNIEGLQIEGYEVTTEMLEETIKVTVDGFAFLINSNFELSDAE